MPWSARVSTGMLALFALSACAAEPGVFQVALNDDTVLLGDPGEEAVVSSGEITVGQSSLGKYLAARHAETLGEFAVAANLMRDVLQEHGDNPDMLRRTHLLSVSEGQFDQATGLAQRIIALGGDAPLAGITLATASARDGDLAAAARYLDAAPGDGTNQLLVPMLKAWVQAGQGDTDKALETLQALGDTPGFEVIADMHAGLIADFAGRPDIADGAFERAIEGGQASLRLRLGYASFLSRAGRKDEARDVLAAFVEDRSDDILVRRELDILAAGETLAPLVGSVTDGMAEGLVGVARALNRDGGNIFSLTYLRMALELRPGTPVSLALLADILTSQGRDEAAIEVLRSIDLGSPYAWFGRQSLARLLEDAGNLDEAVDLLTAMVDERPRRTEAAQALGDLLRINDRFDDAIAAYDTAVARVDDLGREHWRLLYTRGIALERAKRWSRAEEDFLKALELEPDQPLVLNYLGYSWVEQGVNFGQAREMIETAVQARPRDGFIIDSMGWVLYQFGKYDEAVVQLERAVALEPGDPVINDHLGDAYWLVGRKNEARFQWNRALGADPDEDLEGIIREKLNGRELPERKPEERDS